jgi:hypothetical protein
MCICRRSLQRMMAASRTVGLTGWRAVQIDVSCVFMARCSVRQESASCRAGGKGRRLGYLGFNVAHEDAKGVPGDRLPRNHPLARLSPIGVLRVLDEASTRALVGTPRSIAEPASGHTTGQFIGRRRGRHFTGHRTRSRRVVDCGWPYRQAVETGLRQLCVDGWMTPQHCTRLTPRTLDQAATRAPEH